MMTKHSTTKCADIDKIIAAEQKLRAKALRQPTYKDGEPYIMAAVECARLIRRHWIQCAVCQQAVAA